MSSMLMAPQDNTPYRSGKETASLPPYFKKAITPALLISIRLQGKQEKKGERTRFNPAICL